MSEPRTDGLDELDRRGRAAATALRERVDTLVDDAAPTPWTIAGPAAEPGHEPERRRIAAGPANADDEDLPVSLDRPARSRRTPWLAAAAVVALVAASAAIVVREPEGSVSSDQPGYLLPDAAPEGMDLAHVAILDGTGAADAVEADITVYGDPTAADPWAGPLLTVHRLRTIDDQDVAPAGEAGVTVDVGGHDAVVRRISASDGTGGTRGWQVEWDEGDDRVQVSGAGGLTDEDVIAAARAVDADEVGRDGLPEGFAPLASGPLDSVSDPMALVSLPYSTGLVLTYRPPGGADDGPFVGVVQRPGVAANVDMLRAAFPDSEPVEVRGHHGAIGRRDEHVALQWLEPDGQLVSLRGSGVGEEVLLAFAEVLRPASADEVEALAASGPGPLGPIDAGTVEVASGRTGAGRDWRLVVDPDGPESLAALVLEDASGSTNVGADTPGPPPALDLTVVGLDSDEGAGGVIGGVEAGPSPTDQSPAGPVGDAGHALVYGTVAPEATTVTLEASGRPAVELTRHAVDGWSRAVVLLVVPWTDLAGASVVARGVDGAELDQVAVA